MKKIVVTGMGAVTPVGIGVENYWNNITAGAPPQQVFGGGAGPARKCCLFINREKRTENL